MPPPSTDFRIAPYEPRHHAGVLAVVQEVHREYGWSWDAHGYHRDLYEIESRYLAGGGMFWVLLAEDAVVGCAGVSVHGPQCELHRLYLPRAYRGLGWGRRLLDMAMDHGRRRGCLRMIAWSDVALTEAHRLYLKNGFVQEGERICDDPDESREYGFWKEPL